jgi:hypothetical protein
LQLALQLEGYRVALEGSGAEPQGASPGDGLSATLRRAATLAQAIPAIWPSWGDLVVRHANFMSARLRSASADELRQAWRQVEDRSEIVIQHCIDWALRRQMSHTVSAAVAARFGAWDRARREAFETGRRIEAMIAIQRPLIEIAALKEQHAQCRLDAARLLAEARAALEGAPPAAPMADAPTRQALREYALLHERWRAAEQAAVEAELDILDLELTGRPVPHDVRERAGALRAHARACRTAVFAAGGL